VPPTSQSAASSIGAMAALLKAGVPAGKVWRLSQAELAALPSTAHQELERLWQFAVAVGAPLGSALEQLQQVQRDTARTERELSQAMAVPAATRQLLLGLPVVGLILAQLAGFDALAGLLNPLGLAALAIATMLLAVGSRWSRRLLPQAPELDLTPLALLCLQLSLRSGQSLGAAKLMIERYFGTALANQTQTQLQRTFELSLQTGAPIADLILTKAIELREQAASAALIAAQRAGVKLLLPLGLTAMPAFLLMVLVPIFVSLIQNR
jgi:tight adherence protein B